MGILSTIFGGGAAKTVEAVGGAIDGIFTSDDERLSHAEVMERIKQRPELAQLKVNAVEANHRSIFVAGWRPFIGWVCGFGIGYHYVLQPFLIFGVAAWGGDLPELPKLDSGQLMALVGSLLGLGTMRSMDKAKRVTDA